MDGRQRNCIGLGCPSLETSLGTGCFLSQPLPPNWLAELKRDHICGGPPRWLKVMVAYLKMGPQVRTYSDYLRAAWEAKKEDSMELTQGPRTQVTDTPPKPRATSFFPWGNSRATSPSQKSLLCIWKRMLVMMKSKRVTIPAESKELQKSSWYAW